jgi:hypothetical protein
MATRRKYRDEEFELEEWKAELEERLLAARRRTPRGTHAPWFVIGLLCVIVLLGIGLIHYRPDLILGTLAHDGAKGGTTATNPPRPTLDPAALEAARQNADASAAEQQALKNAIPTEDTSQPPRLPVQATAAAITGGGIATTVPAGSFSPSDLGNRPVPTPTTMLTDEQFAASQASEEQNQLNTAASGLTPAQQMVQVHNAEQAAQP